MILNHFLLFRLKKFNLFRLNPIFLLVGKSIQQKSQTIWSRFGTFCLICNPGGLFYDPQ